jgi:hypothetical protein
MSLTKISGSGSVSQRYGAADPDPYQNVTDPQHCVEIKTGNIRVQGVQENGIKAEKSSDGHGDHFGSWR